MTKKAALWRHGTGSNVAALAIDFMISHPSKFDGFKPHRYFWCHGQTYDPCHEITKSPRHLSQAFCPSRSRESSGSLSFSLSGSSATSIAVNLEEHEEVGRTSSGRGYYTTSTVSYLVCNPRKPHMDEEKKSKQQAENALQLSSSKIRETEL